MFESYSYTETGDDFGEYTFTVTDGIRTSSLDATTYDGTDVYTVTQTVSGTFTRSYSGNYLSGNYETYEYAEDEYEVEQVGVGTRNYTLIITGTNAYTDEEEGDAFTGIYTRTKTGTDTWEMSITGTKTGGSYSQTITGDEEYTLTDEGDHGTGHYERTIEGSGNYDRTTTGAGATLPTDIDTYAYTWDQTADPWSGVFDLTPTGSTRYDLLEDFYDISNTNAAQAMGHMNVYFFGQSFIDPTVSIGYGFDISLFGGHYSATSELNIGLSWNNGFTIGPSVTGAAGDGLGLGASIGPQLNITNADSVADLAGAAEQAGVWAAKGPAGGGVGGVWAAQYDGVAIGLPGAGLGYGGGVYHDRTQTLLWQWI